MATATEEEEDDYLSSLFADNSRDRNPSEHGTKYSHEEDKTANDNDTRLKDNTDTIPQSVDNESRKELNDADLKDCLFDDADSTDEGEFVNLFKEDENWMKEVISQTAQCTLRDSVPDECLNNEIEECDQSSESEDEDPFGLFGDTDSESEDERTKDTSKRHGREHTYTPKDIDQRNEYVNRGRVANAMMKPNMWRPTTLERAISEDSLCCICLDRFENPKTLEKCSHIFCADCIDQHFKVKPVCPVCFTVYGIITGTQPANGTMEHHVMNCRLPGYADCQCIVVSYSFDDGIQTADHPYPGKPYHGTSRTGYLPDNAEGRKVLRLLKEGFKRRLVFTVGRSRTTGADNQVTWNDIHHKTSTDGGQQNFGYPDPTYLSRVQEELAAFGVTEDSLKK